MKSSFLLIERKMPDARKNKHTTMPKSTPHFPNIQTSQRKTHVDTHTHTEYHKQGGLLRSYTTYVSFPFEVLFCQILDETVPLNELFSSDLQEEMTHEINQFVSLYNSN